MTLCCGASCKDGVVLATDSMWIDFYGRSAQKNPTTRHSLGGGKMGWVGDRMAFALAGTFKAGRFSRSVGVGLEDTAPIESVARELFARLGKSHISGEDGPMDLMVAGGPAGAVPQLAYMRSDREGVDLIEGRMAMGAHLWYFADEFGLHGMEAPSSVDEAFPLVITLCWAFLRLFYARCGYERLSQFPGMRGEPDGVFPSAAFPLEVVVITPSEVQEYRVPELMGRTEGMCAALLQSYGLTQLPFRFIASGASLPPELARS